jgi:hypothetical protein
MEQNVRYFQYLAGPRNGEVVFFDRIEEEDGIVFICFKDGSRCSEQLIIPLNDTNYVSQLMAEVDSPSNLWTIKEEWVGRQEEKWVHRDQTNPGLPEDMVCVQDFAPGKKKLIPIPPRPTTSRFGQINKSNAPSTKANDYQINDSKTQQQAPNKPQQENTTDPIWMMCEAAKKFDQEIVMTLKVSLLKKSLYNVAKESFENGGQKVVEYIIQNLDDEKIKKGLKEALLEAYGDSDPSGSDAADPSQMFQPHVIEEPIIGSGTMEKE